MKATWKKYTLNFKQASGTSRGILRTKDSYFIFLEKDGKQGIGECGILKGLSADDRPDYEPKLNWLMENIHLAEAELYAELIEFPSIQAGLEMALLDLKSENHILFPSDFTQGKAMQPINGLIWMGDVDFMKEQVAQKLNSGFAVLKMKIGAINFEDELAILKSIRSEFGADELELRVDANGAFFPSEAMDVLNRLADLKIHSIEQPIKKGQWQELAALCEVPPIAIALDEELIGVFTQAKKRELLRTIRPQHIILKPSFVGGFRGSEEWIALAKEMYIGWWATSALESNIGLSAITQWNYTQENKIPSGLGTGSLYTNNFESPLYVKDGGIGYNPEQSWDISALAK
ncbi:o-succinylbenzoate synthase [Owenweeksia hongkongensis]|uniref:o-succinylbenzoate synthase n=1 Tax=Owenweeksia hongkongensis TaxID=253245 RepID=UPI003A8CCF3E